MQTGVYKTVKPQTLQTPQTYTHNAHANAFPKNTCIRTCTHKRENRRNYSKNMFISSFFLLAPKAIQSCKREIEYRSRVLVFFFRPVKARLNIGKGLPARTARTPKVYHLDPICTYIYTQTHTHTHTHVLYIYTHKHTYIYIYICIYAHTNTHTYTYIHMHIQKY